MKPKCKDFFFLLAAAFFCVPFCFGQVSITPNKPDGIYKIGETVLWTLNFTDTSSIDSVQYTLKKGGLTILKKGVIYPKDKTVAISYFFNKPGAVLLDVR